TAGIITGSIAIITEAVHSGIDLVASVIAFASVSKADEPADAEHPYGHQKLENLAAAIEGRLILVGAAWMVSEAFPKLVVGAMAALAAAVAIVVAGLRIRRRSSRVLVDETLPPEELDRIEAAIAAARGDEVAAYHKLRARRAGRQRYIDLHVQFRSGTSLERA